MIDQEILDKELDEKKLIRDFFRNKENGFFIEVGANEPDLFFSQTFHLEEKLNWNGILIEPIDYLAAKLRVQRADCRTLEVACTSPEKVGRTKLQIPLTANGDISGSASLEMNLDHSLLHEVRTIDVNAVTLDSVVKESVAPQVDFLSIDVEGTELDVLRGANLQSLCPTLIIIEDRLVFLEKHLFLRKHGYKIFRRTGFNNWYAKKLPRNCTTKLNQMNLFRKIYLSSWIKRIRETFRMKTFNTLTHL
ncbi:MAG: FkbM family methyltransferase [Verrucomicrobia bacterium]|jgi:FkbM family methyltransferase|nr:FkbM family methyltransferase [Verrucomicrobiota bacterium]